jgi:2-oxo-4-hydroxy-4-carboxy--5-ureidoimidazoline (OHCU) decarboxylase
LDQLDDLPPDAFPAAVAPLFEGAPRFLRRLADARPFGSIEGLFEAARSIAHEMPEEEQIELVDAHPRLGAPAGEVSAMSFVEQGYRMVGDSDAEKGHIGRDQNRIASELARLNAEYERHFGFRYCVFVAGRPRAALLPGFEAALGAERGSELERAIDAVVEIARDRYRTTQPGDESRDEPRNGPRQ